MNNKTLENTSIDYNLAIFSVTYELKDKKNDNDDIDYTYSDFFKNSLEDIKEILKKEPSDRNKEFDKLEKNVEQFQNKRRKKNKN